jgi:hypothetical protein
VRAISDTRYYSPPSKLENLFDRAKALNLATWDEGRPVLERFAKLNELFGQVTYSAADRKQMAAMMVELGLEKSDTGPFVILRRNRGGLLKRPRMGGLEIFAKGRADWAGVCGASNATLAIPLMQWLRLLRTATRTLGDE